MPSPPAPPIIDPIPAPLPPPKIPPSKAPAIAMPGIVQTGGRSRLNHFYPPSLKKLVLEPRRLWHMLRAAQAIILSNSQLAEFSRERAEQQARLVDPVTLAHAVSENVEAQIFCLWARLCVYVHGRITPALRSYLDERCPGFAQTIWSEESRDANDVQFWRMLRKWIDTHVFGRATAEGWNHALGYYTAANPAYKKATERWLETKRELENGTLTDIPLYEFWRDVEEQT